jgi:hypothetical protein
MKLPKGLLIFLAALMLISSSVWLFNQRSATLKRQDLAEEALANSLRVRSQLLAETPVLQGQLAQALDKKEEWQVKISKAQEELASAEKALAASQGRLPGKIDNLDYDEMLLAMCQACGLEVTGMETAEPDQAELSGTSGFMSTTFTINVTGTVTQILDLYNTIVADDGFRTSVIAPLVIRQPLPLTEKTKTELADEFYSVLLAELEASFTPEERVIMVEEAVMEMIGQEYEHLTVDEMTQRILDVLEAASETIGDKLAGQLAADIADALENEVAGSLISTIADIYATAIGELFQEGEPVLTPEFTNLLGQEITEKLWLMPPDKVPGVVASLISEKLNKMVQTRIESMVDMDEVNRLVVEVEEQEGKATGTITVTVTTYEGGTDVQG